jgi:hypothetical protein
LSLQIKVSSIIANTIFIHTKREDNIKILKYFFFVLYDIKKLGKKEEVIIKLFFEISISL